MVKKEKKSLFETRNQEYGVLTKVCMYEDLLDSACKRLLGWLSLDFQTYFNTKDIYAMMKIPTSE